MQEEEERKHTYPKNRTKQLPANSTLKYTYIYIYIYIYIYTHTHTYTHALQQMQKVGLTIGKLYVKMFPKNT